ncbi:MAG: hypothetical protein SFY80_14250 [Verrucomicrobiota bacterium]|nr:hypothetical protein [Verrucomicrobiota bacterium]
MAAEKVNDRLRYFSTAGKHHAILIHHETHCPKNGQYRDKQDKIQKKTDRGKLVTPNRVVMPGDPPSRLSSKIKSRTREDPDQDKHCIGVHMPEPKPKENSN